MRPCPSSSAFACDLISYHSLLPSPAPLALLQTPWGLTTPSVLQVCSTSGPLHLLFPHSFSRIYTWLNTSFFFFRSLHKSPSQWGLSSQKLQHPSPNTPLVQNAFHFLFSLGHTTIWKLWAVGRTTWFCKYCFVGTQPHSFMYTLSAAVFTLQWQSWTAVTETTWSTAPKMFTVRPCTEKVCWSPSLTLTHCLTYCLHSMRSGTFTSFAHYHTPRVSNSAWCIVGAQ